MRDGASSGGGGGVQPIKFNTPVTYWIVAGSRRVPVTDLLDIDGDHTIDPEQTCACVAILPSGQFLAMRCRPEDLVLNGGH